VFVGWPHFLLPLMYHQLNDFYLFVSCFFSSFFSSLLAFLFFFLQLFYCSGVAVAGTTVCVEHLVLWLDS